MPTLLQINTTLNSGSTGRIAEGIGLTAAADGWSSFIAHGTRYKNPSRLQSIEVGGWLEERIHGGWYSLLLDRHGLGSVGATKRLIRVIDSRIKPDIIHLHNIHGYYLNYRILFEYLQKVGIPVVWTLHDCWPITGHCVHFEFVGCDRWQSSCAHCPQSSAYPRSFRDHSARNFRLKKELFTSLGDRLTLVPVSNWLERLLRRSFFRDFRIQTIHNGIDLSVFQPHTANVKSDPRLKDRYMVLGVAAPWTERKGLSDFIKLRSVLPRDHAIVLVGLSEQQIKNLPPDIIGIGRTESTDELVKLYSVADVFVNTTYEDNYPTVNLEAMACGTPVITYRTGGSPEAVTSETGLIVEPGDVSALSAGIREITAGKGKSSYTSTCTRRAEEYFDQNKQFRKYIDLYDNLLK